MVDTVSVACKIPNGLICDFRGAVPKKFEKFVGRRLCLTGSKPSTVLHLPRAPQVVGGFGVTHNVDAEFMTAWLELHADLPAVKNGLVFVNTKADSVVAEANEKAELRSGYEPLSPDKDKLPEGIEPLDEAA